MLLIGTDVVEHYFAAHAGHKGIKPARAQYDAWRVIVETSDWKTPSDVKKAHPKASILKGGRVVFNIKANDYRLVALVQYQAGMVMIRFFGPTKTMTGSMRRRYDENNLDRDPE